MTDKNMILLSFDIEEFDLPTEYGLPIAWEEQVRISREGCGHILKVLAGHGARATFFCTARFAEAAPEVIRAICEGGHEVASHGYAHSAFEEADLGRSRQMLRQMSGQPVVGFRMPRMMHVADEALLRAGYRYNSSLNPTWIPGRYNHLREPRTWFRRGGLVQLPAATTPLVRFPLFWLSFHHLPPALYRCLARRALRHDGYLMLYFHPWEFMPLQGIEGLPRLVTRNSGRAAVERLDRLVEMLQRRGERFGTISEFVNELPR